MSKMTAFQAISPLAFRSTFFSFTSTCSFTSSVHTIFHPPVQYSSIPDSSILTMSKVSFPTTKSKQKIHHLTPNQQIISNVLSIAITKEYLSDRNPVAIFYDLSEFTNNCQKLVSSFPNSSIHGFALKAAPFPSLLNHAKKFGLGGECASIAELAICQSIGLSPSQIIYDSPAKTDFHLRTALEYGVHVNADCIEELARINDVRKKVDSKSTIGLRINPQVGDASIAETFTAARACKFGEPLEENYQQIIQAFREYPFLSSIHVHVGSQGCDMDVLVKGIQKAVQLADEINQYYPNQPRITTIDIGGGLSTNYHSDDEVNQFEEFVSLLMEKCPDLFHYRIMTEFGRRIAAKTAFIAARVESIKQSGGKTYVICHVGADMLMRPVYQSEKWSHRIEVYDCEGNKREDNITKVEVGGPLCFAGDIIAKGRELPLPKPGDFVVVRDTGAYTVAMHSRHTSQLIPAIYGFEPSNMEKFELLKKAETVEDVVAMWS